MSIATVRRAIVAGALIAAPALGLAGAVLQPASPETTEALVEQFAGSIGTRVGLQLVIAAQICWAIGLAGLGHATSRRSPILGTVGGVLGALGAFGHAVVGGAMLMQFGLSERAVSAGEVGFAADTVEAAQSGPLVPYLVLGLFATMLGLVLLAVAVMRSRIAPLWVPILVLVSLIVEFGLSDLGTWAQLAAPVIMLVAFASVGAWVLRSDPRGWQTALEAAPVDAASHGGADAAAHTEKHPRSARKSPRR